MFLFRLPILTQVKLFLNIHENYSKLLRIILYFEQIPYPFKVREQRKGTLNLSLIHI